MGFKSSPYSTTQTFVWNEKVIQKNGLHVNNPFFWDDLVMNLHGTTDYLVGVKVRVSNWSDVVTSYLRLIWLTLQSKKSGACWDRIANPYYVSIWIMNLQQNILNPLPQMTHQSCEMKNNDSLSLWVQHKAHYIKNNLHIDCFTSQSSHVINIIWDWPILSL